MKDIAIYGAGGLGREIAAFLTDIPTFTDQWNLVGFFDDAKSIGDSVAHFGKILGGIDDINAWQSPLDIALCFGSPESTRHAVDNIANPLISFPNIISPDFTVLDHQTLYLGKGNIIAAGCSATTNVRIGNYNLLDGDVHFGHDVTVGDCNAFMPGVRVSGEVSIGCQNLFGAGSFIKQRIAIGNNIVLSPLSVLLTQPKDGRTYIGNPALHFKF